MVTKSPYLKKGRLADIIGAIPVLAAYEKFASRQLTEWQNQLGDACASGGWKEVFYEHPEFFRLVQRNSSDWVGLRWRWALDPDYDPFIGRSLSAHEIAEADETQRTRLTRPPLITQQIESLMATAVKIHASAIEEERHARWWVPIVIPAVTTIVGIFLGVWLKS